MSYSLMHGITQWSILLKKDLADIEKMLGKEFERIEKEIKENL